VFNIESHKYKEFAFNHFLASFLMLIFYMYFQTYGFFLNSLTVLKMLAIVDFVFGVLFLSRIFGKSEDLVYAISAIVEASIWAIYPIQDDLSSHSQMCYMGGVIILCFHLQLTKIKYVYYYLSAVLAAILFIGDFEFGLFVAAHTIIASLLTIEIIRYREKSKKLKAETDLLSAKLHNKNYFSHHLFNPLTIIKGMIGSNSLPEQKVRTSITNCLNRMNGVISQFEFSEEHIVNRGEDDKHISEKANTIAFSLKMSVLIIIALYIVSLGFSIFKYGPSLTLLPKVSIIIISSLFYSFINSKSKESELLGSLIYFLTIFQVLMVLEFIYSPTTNTSISVLLAGFIFSMSIIVIDSMKKIIITSLFLMILSIVIRDPLYILMFIAFLIYFLKVVLGSKIVTIKLEEVIGLNLRMKALYEEYQKKADKIIPVFNQLDKELRTFLRDIKGSSEENTDNIDAQIDELIQIVRED